MEARMAGQPPMDGRRFVGAGVVQDQVDVQARGHPSVDGREELPKLSGALTLVEFPDHFAALRVQRGKQRRRAVARVIVRAPLDPPRPQWQDRLFIQLTRIANDATDYFQIPTGRVVEVGTQVTI